MKMYLGSINDRVWEVTENDFVILDPANPTDNERANKQCDIMALSTHLVIMMMNSLMNNSWTC